jgi:hypothetical protein
MRNGPSIASHLVNDPWRPVQLWNPTTMVQWGRQGLVIGKENCYTTAFFEAFPGNGFIRGEGKTLEEAELRAFVEWQRDQECEQNGGHRLSRVRRMNGKTITYNNGGCFCAKCGAFVSEGMPKIVTLGAYKKPLEIIELESISMGHCRPSKFDAQYGLAGYGRKLELRARAFGIKLPPTPEALDRINLFEDDPYVIACGDAVVDYCKTNMDLFKETGDGSFLDHIHRKFLMNRVEAVEKTDE